MPTPLERAQEISAAVTGLTITNQQATGLRTAIHRAVVEATNDEVQRIRDLEAQLAHVQAGGPLIVCDKTGVRLKVWHAEQQRWYETSLIACGPVMKGSNGTL